MHASETTGRDDAQGNRDTDVYENWRVPKIFHGAFCVHSLPRFTTQARSSLMLALYTDSDGIALFSLFRIAQKALNRLGGKLIRRDAAPLRLML